MSHALTLARPYARAVFALARDGAALPAWSQALAFSADAAARPQVSALLAHPRCGQDSAITLLFPPAIAKEIGAAYTRFLQVLTQARRLQQLPEIAQLFEQLRREAEHVVKATITSASKLSEVQSNKLKAALAQRLGRTVEADFLVDESLLGGAVINAGEVVIDGSVRGKLEHMQAALTY